jgi:hypothetical protein
MIVTVSSTLRRDTDDAPPDRASVHCQPLVVDRGKTSADAHKKRSTSRSPAYPTRTPAPASTPGVHFSENRAGADLILVGTTSGPATRTHHRADR